MVPNGAGIINWAENQDLDNQEVYACPPLEHP